MCQHSKHMQMYHKNIPSFPVIYILTRVFYNIANKSNRIIKNRQFPWQIISLTYCIRKRRQKKLQFHQQKEGKKLFIEENER